MGWLSGFLLPSEDLYDIYERNTRDSLSIGFLNNHLDWTLEIIGEYSRWSECLYEKEKTPIEAARIIERAFKLIKKQ
jgi:hypothetical protein